MRVDVRQADEVIIVDLDGRWVAGPPNEMFREVMNELLAQDWKKILLNLSGVTWIDSAGIGELVASVKLARRFGSSVKLVRAGDRVRHTLSVSQLLPLLDLHETEEEALERFRSSGSAGRTES